MAARRYEVTDEEWGRIKEYIPTAKTSRPPKDHRQMLNAMMWLAKSGAMREDLPERYGPWKTVYSRFCKWRDEEVLQAIFAALSLDADYEHLSIDSSSIKVHQHASNGKGGPIHTWERAVEVRLRKFTQWSMHSAISYISNSLRETRTIAL